MYTFKFIMRDADGAVVSGTPTVTADGEALTPTGDANGWQVDAPLGSLVTATLTGADPLDVLMPSVDPTTLATADDEVPAGYTRISSATYGTLRAGTVIDAYAVADTTYDSPITDPVTVASNGSWYIDLPDAATYVLVGRLAGYATTTQTVVIP